MSKVVVSATVMALALGGCGEKRASTATVPVGPGGGASETAAGTPATGPAVAVVRVSETEYALKPADPRVARAGVVAFTASNDGDEAHALRIEGPDGEVGTPTIAPGARATVKLDLPPGTYKWYCPIADHERRGMVGRVRVAE